MIKNLNEDVKKFLSVVNREPKKETRISMINVFKNKRECNLMLFNKSIKYALIFAIVGELIFYIYLSKNSFMVTTILIVIIVYSFSTVKAHIISHIKNLEKLLNEVK
jgi:hypothetical protein